MQQTVRVIDVTKTFTAMDPQQVEHNRTSEQQDAVGGRAEGVTAYEGYNFLPTLMGYKSFFGIRAKFPVPACPAGVKVDKVFIFESGDLVNRVVLLSDTGIYTNLCNAADSPWVHDIVLAPPAEGIHNFWTTCVINNTLYAYRRADPRYYSMVYAPTFAVTSAIPSFLNMAGQVGLFKAGGRLGFWDTAGSIAWSSFDDHTDFTPSVQTLAGAAIFLEIRGTITFVHSLGDGFVVYATNSVVQINRDLSNTFMWNPDVLMVGTGVAYPDQVAVASPDTTHYCYTSIGLHDVSGGRIEVIATVITDMLRESQDPVLLRLIENRYLFLQLIDPRMVYGLLENEAENYSSEPAPPTPIATYYALSSLDEIPDLPEIAT